MYGCIGDQMTVQLSSVVFVWKNENKNEIIYSCHSKPVNP